MDERIPTRIAEARRRALEQERIEERRLITDRTFFQGGIEAESTQFTVPPEPTHGDEADRRLDQHPEIEGHMQPEEEDDPPNRRTVSACEKGLARPRRVRSPGWRDMPLRHAAEAPMSDVNSGTGRRTGTRRGLPRSASRDDGPDASLLAMTISKCRRA